MQQFVISPTARDIGYHRGNSINETWNKENEYKSFKEGSSKNNEDGDEEHDMWLLLSPRTTSSSTGEVAESKADAENIKDIFDKVETDLNFNEIEINSDALMDLDVLVGDLIDNVSSNGDIIKNAKIKVIII